MLAYNTRKIMKFFLTGIWALALCIYMCAGKRVIFYVISQTAGIVWKGNTYAVIKTLTLPLYYPKQRRKLSIAATQYGALTSFSAQPPPCMALYHCGKSDFSDNRYAMPSI